jgi:formylglycine-generating enzyme required for sulfatase activity
MQNKIFAVLMVLFIGWLILFSYGIKHNLISWSAFGEKESLRNIFIKGGCFSMGSATGYANNGPVHPVCVGDFWMGKYDVTVGEFREFVNSTSYRTEAEDNKGCYVSKKSGLRQREPDVNWKNPVFLQTERDPVVCVSWLDANRFIAWKNKKARSPYRLPTEAEWEYAAREGIKESIWSGTNQESNLEDYAWYETNSLGKTHPVGEKKPNSMGLYDMTGNVWQWSSDWFSASYYRESPKMNPKGPVLGTYRVSRGGDWDNVPQNIQTAVRWGFSNGEGDNRIGFRVVH